MSTPIQPAEAPFPVPNPLHELALAHAVALRDAARVHEEVLAVRRRYVRELLRLCASADGLAEYHVGPNRRRLVRLRPEACEVATGDVAVAFEWADCDDGVKWVSGTAIFNLRPRAA